MKALVARHSFKQMKPDSPVMCELTREAISAGRAGLLPGLAQLATTREMTSNGYRLTFPPSDEALQAITRTIDAERQCCRWLRFAMLVPEGGGPVVLMLSGPDGAQELLSALFDL